MFGGDVAMSGIVQYNMLKGRCTYNDSLSKVKKYLSMADFVVVNLESPLSVKNDLKTEEPLDKNKLVYLISENTSAQALR